MAKREWWWARVDVPGKPTVFRECRWHGKGIEVRVDGHIVIRPKSALQVVGDEDREFDREYRRELR